MRSGSHLGYFYFRSAFVTSASLYLKVPNMAGQGINMFTTIRVTFNFGSIMMKGKTRENFMTITVQENPSFIYHSSVKYG